MEKKLIGFIKSNGVGLGGKRLKDCEKVLNKKGFYFPPLFFGTLNVKLEHDFMTYDAPSIFITQDEIDEVAPGYAEWWRLIPIKSINKKAVNGFIFRTRQNCHGNKVIEIVTEDLNKRDDINLVSGEIIEVIIDTE